VVGVGSSCPHDFRFFTGFFSESSEVPVSSSSFIEAGGVRAVSAGETDSSWLNRLWKSSVVVRKDSAGENSGLTMAVTLNVRVIEYRSCFVLEGFFETILRRR